jgi:hypothetical protein
MNLFGIPNERRICCFIPFSVFFSHLGIICGDLFAFWFFLAFPSHPRWLFPLVSLASLCASEAHKTATKSALAIQCLRSFIFPLKNDSLSPSSPLLSPLPSPSLYLPESCLNITFAHCLSFQLLENINGSRALNSISFLVLPAKIFEQSFRWRWNATSRYWQRQAQLLGNGITFSICGATRTFFQLSTRTLWRMSDEFLIVTSYE